MRRQIFTGVLPSITKLKFTSAKSSSRIEYYPAAASSSTPKRDPTDYSDSAKLASHQQQVRKFLSQKSLEDLLKIPNSSVTDVRPVTQHRQYITNNDESRAINGLSHTTLGDTTHQKTWRNDDLMSHVQHRPPPVSRHVAKLGESYDMIDSHSNSNMAREFEKLDSRIQAIRVDAPHNDREPLLQRHERRFNAQQHNDEGLQLDRISPLGSSQFYRSQTGPFSNNINYHSSGLTSRFQHEKPALYGAQISSQNSSSRYDSSSNRKYESRDTDRTFNSRLHWSCGSCTFNNSMISEICEMCGNRKLS